MIFDSLRARFYLIAIAITTIPVLLLGLILGERSAGELERQSLSMQRELALRVEHQIASFVDIRLNELRVLERTHLLKAMEREQWERTLGRLLALDQSYQSLMVLDVDGRVRASVSRTDADPVGGLFGKGTSFVQPGFWFGRDNYVGPVEYDTELREPLLHVAHAIVERRTGEVVKILFAQIRFKRIWDLLADINLPAGAEAFVVNSQARVLAHRSPAVVLSRTTFELPERNGRHRVGEGEPLLVAMQPLSLVGEPAFVVVTRTQESALHAAAVTREVTLAVTLIVLLTSLLLALLHSRQFVTPIERLAATARRITAGEADARIEVSGPQEIRELGRSLQHMNDRLQTIISQLERSEYTERQRAMVTLESIGDAVITTDEKGALTYLNPVAERITGWTLQEASGRPTSELFQILDEQTRQPVADPVARCLAAGEVIGLDNSAVLIGRNGEELAIQDSAAPIREPGGGMLGVVMVFSDVTSARQMQRVISHQAAHDALTDLVNRREFEQRLTRVLDSARNDGSEHVLCYLDLDQFKVVNDTAGHAAGDALLQQIAALFRQKIRQRDTLARLGGDEFAVLMEHCSPEQGQRVAEMLRGTVEHFRFYWENSTFSVGVSIGLVAINACSESANALLCAADNACYVAKDAGRNRVHVYDDEDADLVKRRDEMRWVEAINRALEKGRFELYAQRIVPVSSAERSRESGRALHLELLVRLIAEDGRHIPPGVFLPAAERFNLVSRVDRWVIENAFDWVARQQRRSDRVLCSINLSGASIGEESFLAFVLGCLDAHGIPGDLICFEITETAAIANLSMATRFIHELRQRGCSFALDDFGSGLSSFAYLKSLPVQFLKIDGVFVKDMAEDPLDRAMVRAINDVGQLLGMRTIAEFVESPQILEHLAELGVDAAQGYHIDRPSPLEQIEWASGTDEDYPLSSRSSASIS